MVEQCFMWSRSVGSHMLRPREAAAIDLGLSEQAQSKGSFAFALNVRPDQPDGRDFVFSPTLTAVEPIFVPPYSLGLGPNADVWVRNQGGEPTCTAQALATTIDIQTWKHRKAEHGKPVSARFIHNAALLFEGDTEDGLPGASIRGALKGFWHRGACTNDFAPYLPGLKDNTLRIDAARDARKVTLGEYRVLKHVLYHFHAAVQTCGSVLTSAMIHAGWNPSQVKRNGGTIAFDKKARKPIEIFGAHAFTIVGFTPEGFLVLNSWGTQWGGYSPSGKRANKLPGVALWTYEDWQQNLLDAWCIRLAPPTGQASGSRGGFVLPGYTSSATTKPSSLREVEVMGHLIHIKNGGLQKDGLFASNVESIEQTGRHIIESDRKYKHVALIFPEMVDSHEAVLSRCRLSIPRFKRLKIYPMFVVCDTLPTSTLWEILKAIPIMTADKLDVVLPQLRNRTIERAAAPFVKALWPGIGNDSTTSQSVFAGITALIKGAKAGLSSGNGRVVTLPKLHIVAHGTGAILAQDVLDRLREFLPDIKLASTSLIAPAITEVDLTARFLDHDNWLGRISVFNRPEAVEDLSDGSLEGYVGSSLSLFSALVDATGGPFSGLSKNCRSAAVKRHLKNFKFNVQTGESTACPGHNDLLGCAPTMNAIANHILNREPKAIFTEDNGGFTSGDFTER